MWRVVLTVSLLCCSCDASVTCRNKNNGEVDWYIIYKTPKVQNRFTGLQYLYIDSTVTTQSTPHYNDIKDPRGVLANTLKPLFTPIRSMSPNFGFISYSDQPPGATAHIKFGHSKGVLMVDKTGTGVWLLHSTPQFPYRRNQDDFWPPSGAKNAQIFMCVTFPYERFKVIGKHLQFIGAYPFEHDIPNDFHHELRDAANWVQDTPSPTLVELVSQAGNTFIAVAKHKSAQKLKGDGDLYISLSNLFNSEVKVQTWGCQRERNASYCPTGAGQHNVINIESVRTDLGEWDMKKDHSKWCVTTDSNRPRTCIADVNRAPTQYERGGGALCFSNEGLRRRFTGFISLTEDCSRKRPHVECDTDSDDDVQMSLTIG